MWRQFNVREKGYFEHAGTSSRNSEWGTVLEPSWDLRGMPHAQFAQSALLQNMTSKEEEPRGRRGRRWRQRSTAARPAWPQRTFRVLRVSKISKICKILQFFANFWRSRSRLYQNEILQENMRLTAFFKLYKICRLLHHCNLKRFFKAKNRFEKSANFVKFQISATFVQMLQILQNLPNFKKFS